MHKYIDMYTCVVVARKCAALWRGTGHRAISLLCPSQSKEPGKKTRASWISSTPCSCGGSWGVSAWQFFGPRAVLFDTGRQSWISPMPLQLPETIAAASMPVQFNTIREMRNTLRSENRKLGVERGPLSQRTIWERKHSPDVSIGRQFGALCTCSIHFAHYCPSQKRAFFWCPSPPSAIRHNTRHTHTRARKSWHNRQRKTPGVASGDELSETLARLETEEDLLLLGAMMPRSLVWAYRGWCAGKCKWALLSWYMCSPYRSTVSDGVGSTPIQSSVRFGRNAS